MKRHAAFRYFRLFPVAAVGLAALFAAAKPPAPAGPYQLSSLDQKCLNYARNLELKIDERGLLFTEPDTEASLNRMAARLASPEPLEPFVTLRVKLFRHPYENAFALPNGSIYFNLGLLARLENASEVAGVLAHELAHILLHHPFLAYRDATQSAVRYNTATVVTGVPAEENLLYYISVNGYRRQLEEEADRKALSLLAAAGYAPEGLIQSLQRMQVNDEPDPPPPLPSAFRDHPSLEKRVEYLRATLPQVPPAAIGKQAELDHAAYLKYTLAVRHQAAALDVLASRYATAKAMAVASLEVQPDDPESLVDLSVALREWAVFAANQKPAKKTAEAKKEKSGPPVKPPKLAEAEPPLTKAVALNPQLARGFRELGELYAQMKRRPEAVVAFQRYLELAPTARDHAKVQRRITELSTPPAPPSPRAGAAPQPAPKE